jgi:hypothetical protein
MRTFVENGSDFFYIALHALHGSVTLPNPVKVGPGCWAFGHSPIVWDKHWTEWLGSLRLKRLKESRLSIIAKGRRDFRDTDTLFNLEKTLQKRASATFYSILMQGAGYCDGGEVLIGERSNKTYLVRSISMLDPHHRTTMQTRPAPINEKLLRRASRIAAGWLAAHKGGSPRLAMGLRAWARAQQEFYQEDKLHQFMRALEAIVKTGRHDIGNKLAARCSSLVDSSRLDANFFRDAWALRSKIEHVEDYAGLLKKRGSVDEVLPWFTGRIEIISSEAYAHVLVNPKLLAIFSDDLQTDAFWARTEHDRQAIWGPEIQVERLRKARTHPAV